MSRTRRGTAAAGAALLLFLPLVLSVLLPGPLSGSLTGTASAQSSPAPVEPEAPIAVDVSTLNPKAPTAGKLLEVAGTLTNLGSVPVSSMRVSLRVGQRLDSRSAIAEADAEGVVTRRVTTLSLDPRPLAAGASAPFRLTTPVDALSLGEDGAYPLEVEVRGEVGDGDRGDVVGLASTFLPWFQTPPPGTTRLAFVWPLVSDPVMAPRRTDEGAVLLDDELATSLAKDGRLSDALKAARSAQRDQACDRPATGDTRSAACRREPVPLTYALDADLLDTVRGMAGGYRVRQSSSRLVPGGGQEAAAAWLDTLREGAQAGDVLALPYADPDVVGLSSPGGRLAADVGPAVQLGASAVEAVVREAPLEGVTLPPPGPLTVDALQAYAGAGTSTLVVGEDVLPPRPPVQTATSGARNPLAAATGPLTGLVVDDGLSRLLAPDPLAPGWQGARLAEQRWIVESAMVTAEDPEATRTLVVAPARDADLVPAVAAQSVLDAGRLPWMCPVPLADVVAGDERCPAGGPAGSAAADRGAPLVPPDDAPVLTDEQVAAVADARAEVDQLTGAVLAPTPAAAQTRARMLRAAFRAESSAWRDPERRRRGRVLASLLQEDVDDLLGKVTLLTGPVTLTSSRGSLSADVQNELDQAVTVKVGVTADNATRLAVQDAGVQQVARRTSVQVRLQAEPRTSGSFPVRAQLYDRLGKPFGRPSEFVIRSTRYGSAALAVTGVAAGVLLVAAGYRLAKRALGR